MRCIRAEEVLTQEQRRIGDPDRDARRARTAAALRLDNVVASYGRTEVVHSVSLSLAAHECLALVGESGSGKTTIARAIAGLHRNWTGKISLGDVPLQPLGAAPQRRHPAPDPVHLPESVRLAEPAPHDRRDHRAAAAGLRHRERQRSQPAGRRDARAGLADRRLRRALSRPALRRRTAAGRDRQGAGLRPGVLVCDEVTSALDVSVQAAIVELLGNLQRDLGLSMLFITHNLPLVRSIAQRVAVLHNGVIAEIGDVAQVLGTPGSALHPAADLRHALAGDRDRRGRPRRRAAAASDSVPGPAQRPARDRRANRRSTPRQRADICASAPARPARHPRDHGRPAGAVGAAVPRQCRHAWRPRCPRWPSPAWSSTRPTPRARCARRRAPRC